VDLRAHIRDIPDFPKPGIVFKDLTPLFLYPPALEQTVGLLSRYASDLEVDLVVAAEARGFILGAAVARELGVGFVPARKPGKLPGETGTARAVCDLVERAGAEVAGCAFVVELAFLEGRNQLEGYDVRSLVRYEEE
jgi:adenine phosphoribosyltransferase